MRGAARRWPRPAARRVRAGSAGRGKRRPARIHKSTHKRTKDDHVLYSNSSRSSIRAAAL